MRTSNVREYHFSTALFNPILPPRKKSEAMQQVLNKFVCNGVEQIRILGTSHIRVVINNNITFGKFEETMALKIKIDLEMRKATSEATLKMSGNNLWPFLYPPNYMVTITWKESVVEEPKSLTITV